MANQEFKKGDRVKITDFTGTIVGTKLEDNSIKYHVKIDQDLILKNFGSICVKLVKTIWFSYLN